MKIDFFLWYEKRYGQINIPIHLVKNSPNPNIFIDSERNRLTPEQAMNIILINQNNYARRKQSNLRFFSCAF